MSLYFEAAAVLANADGLGGSLKNRVFGKKDLKSKPGALYALVIEATKWSGVLKEVIEKSDILRLEKKLTPTLALLLVHDQLLAKSGIAAPKQHVLTLAVTRHKARLAAEFTKCRLRRGFPTVETLRAHIDATAGSNDTEKDNTAGASPRVSFHPRWVRLNTLKGAVSKVQGKVFDAASGWKQVESLTLLASERKGFYLDEHVPNLVAVHPSADLSKSDAYRDGMIIFQDKASCFPAYLLNPTAEDGQVIDATAAPGNKTTHLAAIMASNSSNAVAKVTACERNPARAVTLQKMVRLAGAQKIVTIKASQDFTKLDPTQSDFADVGAILLDPSCSGSGIIGRNDTVVLHLPDMASAAAAAAATTNSRKRKRKPSKAVAPAPAPVEEIQPTNELSEETADQETDAEKLKTRLLNLSSFQLKMVLHAFTFPAATRITYSTCSIHAEENEHVVIKALASDVAKQQGWRILRQEDQVSGMKKWLRRGDEAAVEGFDTQLVRAGVDKETVRKACLRCKAGTEEGTMGFFVAGFVRDADAAMPDTVRLENNSEAVNGKDVEGEEESDFDGFSDGE